MYTVIKSARLAGSNVSYICMPSSRWVILKSEFCNVFDIDPDTFMIKFQTVLSNIKELPTITTLQYNNEPQDVIESSLLVNLLGHLASQGNQKAIAELMTHYRPSSFNFSGLQMEFGARHAKYPQIQDLGNGMAILNSSPRG